MVLSKDEKFAYRLSQVATRALLYEVSLTPKPGLVDRNNSGAHIDMDFYTFIDSIVALTPYFEEYVNIGRTFNGNDLQLLFDELRTSGQIAEKAMFNATNGINTHKGANFAFALILGACGYFSKQLSSFKRFHFDMTKQVLLIVSQMTSHLVANDLQSLNKPRSELTFGEKLYVDYGFSGPRGEAAAGYPILQQITLPFLRQIRINTNLETEFVLLQVMLLLMSNVEDGNLIHRGGIGAWQQIKAEAEHISNMNLSYKELIDKLDQYDKILIQRYLSPGGTADLLSLTIFFGLIEDIL